MQAKHAKLIHLLVPLGIVVAICCSASYLIWTGLSGSTSSGSYGCLQSSFCQDKSCGAGALYAAMARLGEPIYKPDLGRKLVPSEKGLSFAQLEKVAKDYGYLATLKRLTWEQLFAEQAAVLWIQGNHFIAVDPRQKNPEHPGHNSLIRVYDEDKPAKWWNRRQLEKVWDGEVLVIAKRKAARRSKGPCIEWDNCYHNCGFVDRDTPARYTFKFRNKGDMPLSLKVADTGCSCAEATLSEKKLQPGQSGQLDVRVDLQERRGYFQTLVLVQTNDPQCSRNAIYAAGAARLSKLLASRETLYLGNIHQGQAVSRSVFVYDAGDKQLVVTGARLKWDHDNVAGSLRGSARLACVANDADIEHLSKLETIGVEPGDYLVTIQVSVPEDHPQGDFSGHLLISSNLSGDLKQVQVAVRGTVVSDVLAQPSALMLMPAPGHPLSAQVRLKSASGEPFDVSEVLTEGDVLTDEINIIPLQGEVLVKITFSRPAFGDSIVQGYLVFRTGIRSAVKVPVVIYCNQR